MLESTVRKQASQLSQMKKQRGESATINDIIVQTTQEEIHSDKVSHVYIYI